MGTAIFSYKSESCSHPDSCFLNALKTAASSLKYGVYLEVGRQLFRVFTLIVKKRNFKEALAYLLATSFDRLRIPLFLMVNSIVLRGSHCLIKYFRKKNDKWNSLLAGALCGVVSMQLLKSDHWYLVLSLISARIVDAFYRLAIARGILKEEHSNLHFYVMFAFGNMINVYGYFSEGDLVGGDVESLYRRMAGFNDIENRLQKSALVYKRSKLERADYLFPTDKMTQRINNHVEDPSGF